MSEPHVHAFALVSTTWAPPIAVPACPHGQAAVALFFGVTTWTWMCPCGELRQAWSCGRAERGVAEIKFTEVKR